MNLPDRIESLVRQWPQWSRAERRRLDEIVAEVLHHCQTGGGNAFVRAWCRRVLLPELRPELKGAPHG